MDFSIKTLSVTIVLAGLMTHLFALQDTPENRAVLTDRLMRTFPIQDWWVPVERGMQRYIMQNVPNNQRALMRSLMVSVLRRMNWDVIGQATRQTLIEIYSTDELQALIAAYSSPVGRSYLRNVGSYESTENLKAAEGFFSSPIGQSIRRKARIYISKMEPVYKQEMMKAIAIVAQDWRRTREITHGKSTVSDGL
jgi:hypothetical protein